MQHIISIDTETGGFNNKVNALLSIGIAYAVLDDSGEIKNFNFKKEWHISNPAYIVIEKSPTDCIYPIVVEKQALEINKIDIEDFKTNGVSLKQAEDEILNYINNIPKEHKYAILGQNLKFDLGFIRVNMPTLYDKIMRCPTHHELRTASMMYNILKYGDVSRRTAMDEMRKELNIQSEGQTHSALTDAIDNIKVFSEIQKVTKRAHVLIYDAVELVNNTLKDGLNKE